MDVNTIANDILGPLGGGVLGLYVIVGVVSAFLAEKAQKAKGQANDDLESTYTTTRLIIAGSCAGVSICLGFISAITLGGIGHFILAGLFFSFAADALLIWIRQFYRIYRILYHEETADEPVPSQVTVLDERRA